MLHREAPDNFSPHFEVVSCYVEHQGDIILLHRNINKSQGNRWGVPAGKVERGEDLISAMARELKEETGIKVFPSHLQYVDKVFVEHSGHRFIYHIYYTNLDTKPSVKINLQEHQSYRWVTLSEALTMYLVEDLDECIRLFCTTKLIWN